MQPLKGFSSIVLDVVVIKTSPKRFIFFFAFLCSRDKYIKWTLLNFNNEGAISC